MLDCGREEEEKEEEEVEEEEEGRAEEEVTELGRCVPGVCWLGEVTTSAVEAVVVVMVAEGKQEEGGMRRTKSLV